MTQLFEIKEVEGKGLGWVATKNIKRGTVIFKEKPQLALNCCSEEQMKSGNMDIEFSPDLVEKVMSAFNGMNKSDQEEFLTLYNKYDNIQHLPATKQLGIRNRLEWRKSLVLNNLLEVPAPDFQSYQRLQQQNKDKIDKWMKIYNIYETNTYSTTGVYLKISRINHSCRANAGFEKQQVRALYKINAGQEINLSYSVAWLTMKRQERQKYLLEQMSFVCSCEFCKNDCEDEKDFKFYELTLKIQKSEATSHQDKRKLVDLYKEIYKISKEKNLPPHILFGQIEHGFQFGYSGFLMTIQSKNREARWKFEDDCENFAKAAEKFHKILGNDAVDLELWKKRQNLKTYTSEKLKRQAAKNGEDAGISISDLLKD